MWRVRRTAAAMPTNTVLISSSGAISSVHAAESFIT
jgi:hypothetical protein